MLSPCYEILLLGLRRDKKRYLGAWLTLENEGMRLSCWWPKLILRRGTMA